MVLDTPGITPAYLSILDFPPCDFTRTIRGTVVTSGLKAWPHTSRNEYLKGDTCISGHSKDIAVFQVAESDAEG